MCQATVQKIAKFFLYLWGELKLSVAVVTGYRAALNHVFSLASAGLAANRVISQMFRSFEKSCPPQVIQPPDWNLSLVLWSLTPTPCDHTKLK